MPGRVLGTQRRCRVTTHVQEARTWAAGFVQQMRTIRSAAAVHRPEGIGDGAVARAPRSACRRLRSGDRLDLGERGGELGAEFRGGAL